MSSSTQDKDRKGVFESVMEEQRISARTACTTRNQFPNDIMMSLQTKLEGMERAETDNAEVEGYSEG
jgi:hypothetical protein